MLVLQGLVCRYYNKYCLYNSLPYLGSKSVSMGVYYYFHNLTQDEVNDRPIPGFGECTFIAKLNALDEPEIVVIFKKVIAENGWTTSDKIQAAADDSDSPTIVYENGTIEFSRDEEDENDLYPLLIEELPRRYPIVVDELVTLPSDTSVSYDSDYDKPEEDYDW